MDSLELELETSKEDMVSRLDVESIFRSVNEGSQEFTDEDRRSKRRALDSLFRVALEKPGQLTFTGQFMTVFHWDGKTENSINTAVGTIDLFAFSSFGKGNLAFINLQAVGGDGPSRHFNSFSGFHAGAGSTQSGDGQDRLTILEAWTEFKIKFVVITAGKIDLTNYFDPNSVANDEYSQFLSNGFVNNSSLVIPLNTPGVVFSFDLPKGILMRFGVSSLDNSGDDIFRNLYRIAQISKDFGLKNRQAGAIRFLIYDNPRMNDGLGFGISADARVVDKVYAFGRYGKNIDSLAIDFGINKSYSMGLQMRNYPVSLLKDLAVTIGAGYNIVHASPPESIQEEERSFEAYVRFSIKDKFYVSPHYQFIRGGRGIRDNDINILGLRTKIAF
jgi:hypothetical protein